MVSLRFSKTELTKIFSNSTSQTPFIFNSKVFDGVAMGSPVAPVLINLFLGHYHYENI